MRTPGSLGRAFQLSTALPYDSRSATTGSTVAALRAGIQLPNSAAAARIAVTAPNVSGSVGLISRSSVAIPRVKPSDATLPIAIPIAASLSP